MHTFHHAFSFEWKFLFFFPFFLFLSFSFFFFFWDRVFLYISGCPETHSVEQAGLELRNPPATASWVLALKVCATTPGPELSILMSFIFKFVFLNLTPSFNCYNIQILVYNKIEVSSAKYSQLNEYSYWHFLTLNSSWYFFTRHMWAELHSEIYCQIFWHNRKNQVKRNSLDLLLLWALLQLTWFSHRQAKNVYIVVIFVSTYGFRKSILVSNSSN